MRTRPATVNDILDVHVVLVLESFDPIYLNGHVPNVQGSSGRSWFGSLHPRTPHSADDGGGAGVYAIAELASLPLWSRIQPRRTTSSEPAVSDAKHWML